MERLTNPESTKCSMSPWDWCGLDKSCKRDCFEPEPCEMPKMLRRLAEYEDTGLTPKQVQELQNQIEVLSDTVNMLSPLMMENHELRKKQTPKKPEHEDIPMYKYGSPTAICPICKSIVESPLMQDDYCRDCGQAIDWEDE